MPLVVFLFLVFRFVLRERLSGAGIVAYGLTLALLGMVVFNVGLSGLAKLGSQSGGLVAAAFAWALGFGATLAEPALNALGKTVENLTSGAFRKRTLMYAVAIGVAFGIAVGILKIIYGIPLAWLVLPGYAIAVSLTVVSSEEFVNVAWDIRPASPPGR